MELRCPECCSPEVQPDPQGGGQARRCDNCGARFPRDSAFVTVLEAEACHGDVTPPPLFVFSPMLALIELGKPDGAIRPVSPHSDPDELHQLLDSAQVGGIIESRRPSAWILVHPDSLNDPAPLLVVSSRPGLNLLGRKLSLDQEEGEDPGIFTTRLLARAVKEANALAEGPAADGDRLDRLAAFLNRLRDWNDEGVLRDD